MLSRQIGSDGIGGVLVQGVAGIVAAVVRGSLRSASSCTSRSEAPVSRTKVIAERRSDCGNLGECLIYRGQGRSATSVLSL